MNHPLNTTRYICLADKLFTLIDSAQRYLDLKIASMEKELEDQKFQSTAKQIKDAISRDRDS